MLRFQFQNLTKSQIPDIECNISVFESDVSWSTLELRSHVTFDNITQQQLHITYVHTIIDVKCCEGVTLQGVT